MSKGRAKMTRFKQFVKDEVIKLDDQQTMMKKDGYYHAIMEDEKCTYEEAVRLTIEVPTYRIGIKMIDYGLWGLKTKKGRQKFRDTKLDPEEAAIWDSPDRPDNIAKLIAVGTVETVKYVKGKVKR